MAQDKFTYLIRVDRNGTKIYEDWRCPHCWGAGGADCWIYTGYTCYQCGGSGKRSKPKIIREYTPEYQAKLDAQRAKRAEKKLAEERAHADELNAGFFKRNGFDAQGNMWIVLGNSYELKDSLKEMGCKFIKALSCWSSDHELESIKTIKVHASDLYESDEAGVYLWRWMKVSEGLAIIQQANDDLRASESKSTYVGKIGDKIEVKARLTRCHSYDSTFNHHTVTTFINIFTDEAGNVYVWKSTAYFDAGLDDQVILKGTVKDHSEYNGIKQTILTRCKVTKEVM